MKIFEKRLVSFLLALIMVVGLLPPVSLKAKAETTGLDGKTISILGDSISTYQNYSNGTAAGTTNSTITNGAIYYPRSGFDVTVDSTWWYQAAQALDMEILVNNSWSGSCLLNTRSGTVGAYVDRCVQLHDDTGDNAGQEPDIIAIFLGTNDYYTYPGTLGSYESIAFDTLITKTEAGYAYAEPATSMEAYAIILHKIAQRYPEAEVYCFTLLPRVNSTSQPTAVNEDIRQLANHFGAITVDLHNCGIQPDSTHMGDNLHPNSAGMDAMTNAFVSAVLKNSGEMTYDVSFNLDGVVAMEGTTRTVIAGDEFRATLKGKTGNRQLDVSVYMGGADITAQCYADGVVQIPAVNGDVVITASLADRDPLNFRWEYDAQQNAMVSGSADGNTENALTMTSGSITDGKFSKVKYTLDEAVILKHDKPWVIEWKSSGTWTDTTDGALLFAGAETSTTADTPYLYRRHNSDFIAFGVSTGGQYHNYGVKLGANGIDGTVDHTYKLENRINADGSNMVYLYVDDQEIGPMNHHWVGGTDKKETVDWLNGQDLVFTHMGTNPHTIGNCYIDYIQVWENGAKHVHKYTAVVTAPTCTEQGYTTYTCQCGDNYVANYVEAKDHEFGEVTRIDNDSRRSVCNVCGVDKIYERLTLPAVNNGEVYVENNTEGLYYGSANIADLLGLKDGTYTEGDVTITIEGTKISAHGTPAKTLYFDLQKGTFGVPDYQRDPGYELPDGSYRFGLLGEGEVLPTACIRNKDGVGNILARAGMSNHNSLIGNNFGIPYLYLPAGKTYDFDGKFILTMGMDASADSETPNTQVFSGDGILTEGDFLWSMDADIAVFGTIGSRDSGKIRYRGGSKEYINIYLPSEVGYLQIQMDLANKETTNAYGWRLNMMYACDNNLKQLFPVTSTGEYEAAIRLIDRADFMGMGAHGSERMTSFAIYIDGVETSLDALTTMSNWQTIRIKRESDFYDPLDETTLVATHTVVYDFDLSGLTVTQDVDWLVDEVCTTSYMMMFPVRRAYDNLQVSNTYYDDYDSTWYDVSQTGFTTYPVKWTTGATKMTLFSDKSGITATMESLETMQLTGSGYKHCANSGEYNKLYFTICGGGGSEHTVTAGDNWHTKHRYEVTITQGTDCFFGHNYVAAVTAPTCTEQGYTTYTCQCGDSYVDDYVDADGHDFTDWYMTREATYEQAGEESRDCKKCSHVEFRAVEVAVVTSGNVGYGSPYTDAVTYTLYADGTMVIAGSGTVYCSDWRGNNQPYYAYRDQVKNLIIEEGITQTSGGCFAYFVNLERVSFPDSLIKINKNAFMNSFVSSMTSITIPATVTYLADYAFGFYSGAASATFTDVIIENPNASFHTSNAVFNSGKKLQNLTLYSYGTENNVRTYAETHGCRYVDLNNYMEGDFGDIHYELSNGVLVLEPLTENAEITAENQPWASMVDQITKIVISDGVTTIADNAFADYTALTEVELPHGLEVIGDGVFAVSQSNDTSLTMALPRRLTAVGEGLFAGRSNVSLTVYYGSLGAEIAESGVTLDVQKVFKILLIGNSFSEDASNAGMPNSQMLDILQAMLGEDAKITVGLCYSGGKGLNWHATQSEQGNSSYSLRVISTESGAWKNYGSYTSAKALTWTDWDVVSLQHYEINTTTGKESNAYSDQVDPKFDNLESATEFMLDYVDAYAPDATVYFYMHWSRAYKANLNESLAEYNKMAAFFPVVMDYAGPESNQTFEGIIPVGLAVQNARTIYLAMLSYNSEKGITVNMQNDPQIGLQRDGGHMTYNVGRYIAALTFAETIIPEDMRAEGYVLPEIRVTESVGKLPKEYSIIAQKSVLAAVNSWKNGSLAVTNIEGYTEDPTVAASETLKKLPLELNCGDAEALVEQICTTVLSALPADFAVDAVTVDTATQTASVTIRFGYTSVVVEMGYTLSAHSYENGVCTICGQKEPIVLHSYRWEIENNAMVSVATNGNTVNDLTLNTGSITGGALKNIRYSLNKAVNLYHDVPWVIEWRSSGNWDGMLLASNADTSVNGTTYLFRFASMNFLALGDHTNTWNNYGLIHEIDMSVPHLFRLENRIGADGTNTVYLLVDGVEIDAMHHYYNSGTNQNQIVNWANGRNIVFGNIGTSSHPVNNMQLEYLQIWENGHDHDYRSAVTAPTCTEEGYTTYTCDCGSSYVGDYVDAVGHSYENGSCKVCGAMASNPYAGKTIACIGDSITAAHGVTKDKTDYVKLLADRLEMNYIRLGASGTTLCTDGSRTCNIDKLTESKLQGADVVTIAMGINDFCGAGAGYYELGDIHSTDSSTIYGAVRMWCEQIVELRKTDSLKDTQFYFMTPLITSWNNSVTSVRNWDQSKVNIHGYTLRDLCNAIIEVAALYDVAVIDMNLISCLYYVSAEDNNIDVFGGDGVHPGDEGHAMMAAALEDALLERYLLDDHDHSYGSWITTTYPDCEGGEEKRVCGICRATESRALPAIPTEENVHLSQKAKLQPDGSFTFTLEIYASEKVALYEDAVIRYVLNQGFVMTEKSEVKAVRVSELLSGAVLYEVTVEATELTVTVDGGVLDVTGYDLSKSYIAQDHAGSKLVITISNVEATDDVIWGENMDISTADSGIWADGAMAVAFTRGSAFFHESVYVMDYAEEITLEDENILHLDADGMDSFADATDRLEMTYGTAQIKNGSVVYVPDTMQWNGYDRFYAFAGQNEAYQWTKMAVIPANNVYYEDTCIAISAEEATQGAGIYYTNGTKPENVAQDVWDDWCGLWESVSDNKTGNPVEDSSDVQGWIENLAGQTGFTGGSAHLVQAMLGQSGNSVPKATFTFTGTGVDIYSFTNNTTGTVMVQVSDVKGIYPSSYYIVDTGANTAEGYYQVPTISFVGKGHSTYQVTIMVTTAAASENRFAFYLDGIRVYNPLEEDAKDETVEDAYGDEMHAVFGSVRQMLLDAGSFTGETGEGTGFVFLDRLPESENAGNTNVIGTYAVYGPKNEVYLAKGQAIAFKVDETLYSRVQVGLKSLTGENVQAVVSYFDEESDAAAQGLVTISHTADLYYELMPIEGYVVIRNTSDAILAVTKVKLMVSGDPQQISAQVEKVSQAEVLEAVDEFDALPMMTYRLRNFRPDVEITQPEISVEELAAAQLRALIEKIFGSVRKWFD